jgi:Activator of Hsp90 ATPase, N-terminal
MIPDYSDQNNPELTPLFLPWRPHQISLPNPKPQSQPFRRTPLAQSLSLSLSPALMARFGEGDKRWIVEERPDGTNVHNWHWSERDCLDWSRSLLSDLLSDLPILNGEGGLYIRTKGIDKVEGEAYVNVRKGKVIPGYELSIKLAWEGEAKDAAVKVTGLVEVPYLADENAGEDPDLKVSVRDDDGSVGRRIKDAILTKGNPLLA